MARAYGHRLPSVRSYLVFVLLVSVASGLIFVMYLFTEPSLSQSELVGSGYVKYQEQTNTSLLQKIKIAAKSSTHDDHKPNLSHASIHKPSFFQKLLVKLADSTQDNKERSRISLNRMEHDKMQTDPERLPSVNYNVHIFYYPWYGKPEIDGKYIHWNHRLLPYWKKQEAGKWPSGIHIPPEDIGANFYPALGPYSSADPKIVSAHMAQIRSTGTGVVAISWYPPGETDENGHPFDKLVPVVLEYADLHELKVCIHIEPYKNRSAETLKQHVKYVIDSYGQHPAFYRTQVGDRRLPVFYVYDSYQVPSSEWAKALKPGGHLSLRGTEYDAVFIGLYLSREDEYKILGAGFDGFYTYFAAKGFTEGSTWINWNGIAKFASQHNLLFIPSIGPGYVDTRIRPWNGENTRKREQGAYFNQSFQAALDAGVKYFSVTSFNEWHEGTQVELAVPKQIAGFTYEDYSPNNPDFYLRLLGTYVEKFSQQG